MIPAVLTDFDDTAAVQNVAEMLLRRFGDPTWEETRRRFRAGEISLKDYQEITFRNIQSDCEEMQAFVRENANLRPHFGELWNYCRERNYPMAVVSLGLDFYIKALLESEGFPEVPVYCVNTRFSTQGIAYYYHHAYPGAEDRGNSKGLIVDRYRQLGYQVIYAGDGRSDFEAAEIADTVFARSFLAEKCQRQNLPFLPFGDFGDVLKVLKELPEPTQSENQPE